VRGGVGKMTGDPGVDGFCGFGAGKRRGQKGYSVLNLRSMHIPGAEIKSHGLPICLRVCAYGWVVEQ